jgi:hypothetical protein
MMKRLTFVLLVLAAIAMVFSAGFYVMRVSVALTTLAWIEQVIGQIGLTHDPDLSKIIGLWVTVCIFVVPFWRLPTGQRRLLFLMLPMIATIVLSIPVAKRYTVSLPTQQDEHGLNIASKPRDAPRSPSIVLSKERGMIEIAIESVEPERWTMILHIAAKAWPATRVTRSSGCLESAGVTADRSAAYVTDQIGNVLELVADNGRYDQAFADGSPCRVIRPGEVYRFRLIFRRERRSHTGKLTLWHPQFPPITADVP